MGENKLKITAAAAAATKTMHTKISQNKS